MREPLISQTADSSAIAGGEFDSEVYLAELSVREAGTAVRDILSDDESV